MCEHKIKVHNYLVDFFLTLITDADEWISFLEKLLKNKIAKID